MVEALARHDKPQPGVSASRPGRGQGARAHGISAAGSSERQEPEIGQSNNTAGRLPRHAPPVSHQRPEALTASPSRPRSQATVANSSASSLQSRRGLINALTSARAASSRRCSAAGNRTRRSTGLAASLCAMRAAWAVAKAAASSAAVGSASMVEARSVMSGTPGCYGTTNPRKAGECRDQKLRADIGLRTTRRCRHPCPAVQPACAAGVPTPHACRADGWIPWPATQPGRCRTHRHCDAAVPAAPPPHG